LISLADAVGLGMIYCVPLSRVRMDYYLRILGM
jgi:hypothetical protein